MENQEATVEFSVEFATEVANFLAGLKRTPEIEKMLRKLDSTIVAAEDGFQNFSQGMQYLHESPEVKLIIHLTVPSPTNSPNFVNSGFEFARTNWRWLFPHIAVEEASYYNVETDEFEGSADDIEHKFWND